MPWNHLGRSAVKFHPLQEKAKAGPHNQGCYPVVSRVSRSDASHDSHSKRVKMVEMQLPIHVADINPPLGIHRMMYFYPKTNGGAAERTDWKRVCRAQVRCGAVGLPERLSLPSYAGVTKKKCKQTSSPPPTTKTKTMINGPRRKSISQRTNERETNKR